MQLYLPDDTMFNKDFLKLVLADEKKLMPINEVRFINVPHYDEVSVKRLWPKMKLAPTSCCTSPTGCHKVVCRKENIFLIL